MGLNKINFKLLRAFQMVAEHRSFRAAAEQSQRSASAMTMQIQELETQMGISLFHRTSRKVQLTPEGEYLLSSVQKATKELDTALQHIQNSVDLHRGHLSIASIPTIAQVALPSALVEFYRLYPSISVHLRELMTSELLESVRHRDVEFAIGGWVKNRTEFNFQKIVDDPICAIFPPSHPLARAESITFEQANQYPLLTLAPSTALRMHLDEYLQARDIKLKPRYESRQAATMMAMSAAGLGVAILTRTSITNFVNYPIKAVPISDPGLILPICRITLRGDLLSPAGERMAAIIDKHLKNQQLMDPAKKPSLTAVERSVKARASKTR